MHMRIIRFFDMPDGGSRFEEVEIAFPLPFTDEFGHTYHLTKPLNPLNAIIADLPHGLDQDWHVAPNRQIVIVLRGVLEVQTTDGEKRRWSAGGCSWPTTAVAKGIKPASLKGRRNCFSCACRMIFGCRSGFAKASASASARGIVHAYWSTDPAAARRRGYRRRTRDRLVNPPATASLDLSVPSALATPVCALSKFPSDDAPPLLVCVK
jgi:hypothetical protein